jgi:hypothetical protein
MSPMVKTAVVLFNVLHELSKLAVHLHRCTAQYPIPPVKVWMDAQG